MSPVPPSHQLTGEDYLELWKYFQSRADQIKEDMFKTITWVIGFAAALLGFIATKFVELDPAKPLIRYRLLAAIFCLVGLVLCGYAAFLLSEFAAHISGNWERSDRCKDNIGGLNDVIKGCSAATRKGLPVWWRIGGVVIAFGVAFASGFLIVVFA